MANVSYIPNDPLASGGPAIQQVRASRQPLRSAGFDIQPAAGPGTYQPQTPEFAFWQVNEALVRGLKVWRDATGAYPSSWYGGQPRLRVLTDAGDDLNAFYDRRSLQFFHHAYGGQQVFSSESVDVAVHEEGHALLDMLRPDFFDVPFIEVGALHESFGDCIAVLAALSDRTIRESLVSSSPDLAAMHFVQALAEQLGDAIRREYGAGSVDTGALRNAMNTFSWSDPTTLPPGGPAAVLSGEVHSFSRVFTGAFYDSLRNMYLDGGSRSGATLRKAARTVGRLLITALATVPATPRTFEGVGWRMVEADVARNGGANSAAIRAAFKNHGINLPAPSVQAAVPMRRTRGGATQQLREEMEVPSGARLRMTPVESDVHGSVTHVAAFRPMQLTEGELAGVRLLVPATAALTRRTRGRSITGVLGEVQPADAEVEQEGRAFARALLANGDIRATQPEGAAAATRRRTRGGGQRFEMRATARPGSAPFPPTHEIRIVGGEPFLARVGFSGRGR
jgi:hypothetical protein